MTGQGRTEAGRRRRRVGVLTFHRCINYGSYWQARCLVEGLRARGHDAVLLDHRSRAATLKEWRCAFQPLLPDRTAAADLPRYAAKVRAFERAVDRLPLSQPFPLDDPAGTDAFDLVVIGSDEVWNLSHPWYGCKPAFFGSGLGAAKVVSYAASFGSYDAAKGLDPGWADRLRGLDAIAVRDENSRRLIVDALGAEPAMVLDPCLQFPPPSMPTADEAPYALVYGHGLPGWFRDSVRRWADARGLRLVAVGYATDWADEQRIDADPIAFAGLMAGASAVVTNFFHGCVFAMLNGKPFAAALSPYRVNKVRDLTTLLDAARHVVTEADAGRLADLLDRPLDPAIGTAIDGMRVRSDAYLDAAVG